MVIIPGVEVDETRLAAICEKYGIAELKVFGSRARGQAAPDGDRSLSSGRAVRLNLNLSHRAAPVVPMAQIRR